MRIGEYIKQMQPQEYRQLISIKDKKIKTVSENMTMKDYEKMMGHSSYRRGPGGFRQVR